MEGGAGGRGGGGGKAAMDLPFDAIFITESNTHKYKELKEKGHEMFGMAWLDKEDFNRNNK